APPPPRWCPASPTRSPRCGCSNANPAGPNPSANAPSPRGNAGSTATSPAPNAPTGRGRSPSRSPGPPPTTPPAAPNSANAAPASTTSGAPCTTRRGGPRSPRTTRGLQTPGAGLHLPPHPQPAPRAPGAAPGHRRHRNRPRPRHRRPPRGRRAHHEHRLPTHPLPGQPRSPRDRQAVPTRTPGRGRRQSRPPPRDRPRLRRHRPPGPTPVGALDRPPDRQEGQRHGIRLPQLLPRPERRQHHPVARRPPQIPPRHPPAAPHRHPQGQHAVTPPPARARTRDDRTAERRVRLGSVTVTPVVQFHYRVHPLRLFSGLDLAAIDEDAWFWQPPYREGGMLVIDIGAFVVRTPQRTLLVDAGVGNGKRRPNPCFDDRSDDWPAALLRAGTSPDEIDTVVFTHLHVDHVGFASRGSGSGWVPAFPRARDLATAAELDYWTGDAAAGFRSALGGYLADSVLPLRDAGVLDLVEPNAQICDEVRLVSAPGHTP